MRAKATTALLLLVSTLSCYDQPPIPRDRPLGCNSNDAGECPEGFQCVPAPGQAGGGICAPEQCADSMDCPAGLVCSERSGCVPASAAGDGGAGDGGTADGGAGDGGLTGLFPDAPTSPDLDSFTPNPTLDAQGGF